MTYIYRNKADELLRFARREKENATHYNTLALVGTATIIERLTNVNGENLMKLAREMVATNKNWLTYETELNKLGIGIKEVCYE